MQDLLLPIDQNVRTMEEKKPVFSYHTFIFPFQWDYIKHRKKNTLYNQRTDLRDFDRLFEEVGFLRKTPYRIDDSAENYNEYTYFHPFARQALYYLNDNDILRYYELNDDNGEYVIEYFYFTEGEKNARTLTLALNSICLHVYDTGVGVLSFNLSNQQYPDKETILIINEYGRRIYPQFLQSNNRLVAKNSFLANKISGKIGPLTFSEDFTAYNKPVDVQATFLPPDHIKKIFGYSGHQQPGDLNCSFVFTKESEHDNCIRIRQITDDRMFFLCYYENAVLAYSMAHRPEEKCDDQKYQYELDEFWYAFVFGDAGRPTVKEDRFQMNQIRKHSYTRWLDYNKKDKHYSGSLFGFSRDSFVCLGGWNELGIHMNTMYYQMAILCLVQRASILRFSFEITKVTKQVFDKSRNTARAIKELYENYIQFINRIYFREITSQIQGIEMYLKFQEVMGIEKDVKDLDDEMEELFHYLDILEQRRLNKTANLYLPIAAAAGFLGINTFISREGESKEGPIGLMNKPLRTNWHELTRLTADSLTWGDLITFLLFVWILYAIIKTIFNKK